MIKMIEEIDEDVIFILLPFPTFFWYALRNNLIIFLIFCGDYLSVEIHHLAVLWKNWGLSESEL